MTEDPTGAPATGGPSGDGESGGGAPAARLRFGPDWQEEVTLRDGSRALLRAVRPDDKALLQDGLTRLSEESRYRRFLAPKDHLTAAELRYLTEVDQVDHVALGAVLTGEDGRLDPVGIARFVRLPEDPHVAEAAVAVVDDMHGRGLGRILLLRLVDAALERGVTHFRCTLFADNQPMRALLEDIADHVIFIKPEGAVATLDVPLRGRPADLEAGLALPEPPPTPLDQLFRVLAEGLVTARRMFSRWVEMGDARPGGAPPAPGSAEEPPAPEAKG